MIGEVVECLMCVGCGGGWLLQCVYYAAEHG